MFGSQYDFLRIDSKLALKIQHSLSYIKRGQGQNAIRMIFGNQELDSFEKQQLQQLDQEIQSQKVPNNIILQNTGRLLQFLYANKFNISKAVKAIVNHIDWLTNKNNYELTVNAQNVLDKGWVYIYGRDFQLRPVICFNADRINFDQINNKDFQIAVNRLLLVVQEYMFYPAQIENWLILIDANNKPSHTIKPQEIQNIQEITQTLQDHFPCCLEKCYIVNIQSELKAQKYQFEKFVDPQTRNKLLYLDDQARANQILSKVIDYEELEEKFGGARKEPIQYWPPQLVEKLESKSQINRRSKLNDNSSQQSRGSFKAQQLLDYDNNYPKQGYSTFRPQQTQKYQQTQQNQLKQEYDIPDNSYDNINYGKKSYQQDNSYDQYNDYQYKSQNDLIVNDQNTYGQDQSNLNNSNFILQEDNCYDQQQYLYGNESNKQIAPLPSIKSKYYEYYAKEQNFKENLEMRQTLNDKPGIVCNII